MTLWKDLQTVYAKAAKQIRDHEIGQTLISGFLGGLPFIGTYLSEYYDRNFGSDPSVQDILRFLEALSAKDEAQFQQIASGLALNREEILRGTKNLTGLINQIGDSIVERVDKHVDQVEAELLKALGFQRASAVSTDGLLEKGVLHQVFVGEYPIRLAASPSGEELYVANFGGGSVSVVNVSARRTTRTIEVGAQPSALAVSPPGDRLFVGRSGSDKPGVTVVPLKVSEGTRTVPTPGPVRDLAITPDGSAVFLALENEGLARLDAQSLQLEFVSKVRCPEGVVVSPDGRELFVSFQCDGPGGLPGHDAVGVFDVKSGRLLASITGMANVGGAISVSPNGRKIWINGSDACSAPYYDKVGCPFVPGGIINVIDTAERKPDTSLGVALSEGMGLISFLRDGKLAVVGGNRMKLYNTDTFELERFMRLPLSGSAVEVNHGQQIWAASPFERRIVQLDISGQE